MQMHKRRTYCEQCKQLSKGLDTQKAGEEPVANVFAPQGDWSFTICLYLYMHIPMREHCQLEICS
jgi:hypothetical protein